MIVRHLGIFSAVSALFILTAPACFADDWLDKECKIMEKCCSAHGGSFTPQNRSEEGITSCSCRNARPIDEYTACKDRERAKLKEKEKEDSYFSEESSSSVDDEVFSLDTERTVLEIIRRH